MLNLNDMSIESNCPKCRSQNIYADGNTWVCPSCSHEWSMFEALEDVQAATPEGICDAHGNQLNNGDAVTVLKELRVKGSSAVVKVGTKVKNIRLTDGDDGHNIACKIDGIGSIHLKSEFVKKA
jgi:protein PhnA